MPGYLSFARVQQRAAPENSPPERDSIYGAGGRRPRRSEVTSSIRKTARKTTNRTFAIHAAVAATPLKPNTPAMSATTRKVIAHPKILMMFLPLETHDNSLYFAPFSGDYHPAFPYSPVRKRACATIQFLLVVITFVVVVVFQAEIRRFVDRLGSFKLFQSGRRKGPLRRLPTRWFRRPVNWPTPIPAPS
jgi:hypothetical protein